MRFKILKKDLKRKMSMNITIIIFVILTTMFVAASINNLRVSMIGVDEFMDVAKVRDFTILVKGEREYEPGSKDEVTEFLDGNELVEDYFTEQTLTLSTSNMMMADGSRYLKFDNTIFAQANTGNQIFFDADNKKIGKVEDGTIYVPEILLNKNDLDIGDEIKLKYGDREKNYRIVGILKDAFLGSNMMGNKRVLVSDKDFKEIADTHSLINIIIYGVTTENPGKLKNMLAKTEISIVFAGDKPLIKTTYIMDMVIALVLLLVGICLVAISGIMLRYTIVFTVNEDYKEIGIMKAIGLKSKSIRKLYASKYLIISVVGAFIGFLISIPFSSVLLRGITKTIVLKDTEFGFVTELATAASVAVIVTFFAYRGTKPIKKLTPMDAIRGGNNGERFRRKNIFSLRKTKLKANSFMAVTDVIAEWKKYIVLVATSMLGIWLVVMPANTINTLSSDYIVEWFGMVKSDYAIMDDEASIRLIDGGDKQDFMEKLEEIKNELTDAGIEVEKVCIEAVMKCSIRKGDKSCWSLTYKGHNTKTRDYNYTEGTAPYYENEIAITHVVADEIDAELGDTVYVKNGDKEKPYVITAIFQTMNNQGQGVRFGELAEVDYLNLIGTFSFQVMLKEGKSEADIKAAIDKTKKIYPNAKVMDMKEYSDSSTGGVINQLRPIKKIILVVVIIINFLVVTLMQKMFVIREQGEMGMLKAIGFTNKSIIIWQAKRACCAIILGIVLGTLTGTWFSQITSGLVFKLMGASKISFQQKPLEVYVLYPAIIVVMTILGCVLTMRKIKKINVFSMNDMD